MASVFSVSSAGEPVTVGDEFRVNDTTYQTQHEPSVTALSDGGFAVSWSSNYQDDPNSSNYGVFTKRFDADGTSASSAQLVGGTGNQTVALADNQLGLDVDLGAGDDSLTLSDSRDTLTVANVETVNLGEGNDFIQVQGSGYASVYGDKGDDHIYGGSGDDYLYGNEGADQLSGSAGNDYIYGNADADRLDGGLGNDVLDGGAGNDILTGGLGTDILKGGADDDVYYISDLSDTVIEHNAEGSDTIYSTLETTTLSANVETLYMIGDLGLTGIGNAGDNEIFGNVNNNILTGGFGNDILRGGAGDDVATFLGNASDYAIDLANMTVTDLNSTAYGDEGMDTLVDIETLRFGDGAELTVSVTELGEFQVNTTTSGQQYYPSTASFGDGNFVVTWHHENSADIYGQHFNIGRSGW